MPLISSRFKSPSYLRGGDLQTLVPAIFRRVDYKSYIRERIKTPDNDFLDIDWLPAATRNISLLLHGLEASAKSTYLCGMAHALNQNGNCVAALNLRGCSGEPNLQVRSYHSGQTEDIELAIQHLILKHPICSLTLVGFSLGGNLVLKYLGEKGKDLHPQIKRAVVISVPCDLRATAINLNRIKNKLYQMRFLKSLKSKLRSRVGRVNFELTEEKIKSIHSLKDFDNVWTAPFNGFRDAEDYWEKCSSKQFIQNITIPTLILNAKNDPFFTPDCLPINECKDHRQVYLETPHDGGHVGFSLGLPNGKYYSEIRAIEFLNAQRF